MNHSVNTTEKLLAFLEQSPTAFHAVKNLSQMLSENGYLPLSESKPWNLKQGGKYYVARNGSALIAFRLPKNEPKCLMLCASHSDSPTFKIKRNAEMTSADYVRINTECYGGAIYSTWLDKPLSVAGRLIVKTEEGMESRLIAVDKDILLIPNTAIHMNRSINTDFHENPAVDLVPLFSSGAGKGEFLKLLAESAKAAQEDILDYDLFLYNRQKPIIWGKDGEFFSSPRIDDLHCAYSSIVGLLQSKENDALDVAAVFDNEETGNLSKQGANSDFLSNTLEHICTELYGGRITLQRLLANGLMVSADNAHAVHPNHPEYADATHRPKLNGGVVIKYCATQKYTSDGISAALMEQICQRAGVPCQRFANRSDMAGGSTLGNSSNAHLSLNTVDIGAAQLAMHSSYETAGSKDTEYMIGAMQKVFESIVENEDNQKIRLF